MKSRAHYLKTQVAASVAAFRQTLAKLGELAKFDTIEDDGLSEKLAGLRSLVGERLQTLGENLEAMLLHAEWERMHVGLYGETQHGKSTLIESLTRGDGSSIGTGRKDHTREVSGRNMRGIRLLDLPGIEGDQPEIAAGDYVVVDTPGLFPIGLMHEERTRKYISEANLILFVLPPQNSLKQSHREVVTWLLVEIGKLSAIVFVVNKMDEVADIEDDVEFRESAAIRREVVGTTLTQYLGSPVEPQVVCVAADPRQKGLDYWVQHPEEYEALSRISDLREVMGATVRLARENLIVRAGFDVLRESRGSAIGRLRDAARAVDEQLKLSANAKREVGEEIGEVEQEASRTWAGLMKEFENERKRLILGIAAQANPQSLATYVKVEIGKEGDELLRRIDRFITLHAEPLAAMARRNMERIEAAIEFETNSQKKVFDVVGKVSGTLSKWLGKQSSRGLADALLKLNRAWKFTKFKPWGAVKIANKFKVFGKVLAVLGPILDVLGPVMQVWADRKLQQAKWELTESIDSFFRELRADLTLDALKAECCAGLLEAQQVLAGLLQEETDLRTVGEKLRAAQQMLMELKFQE